MTTSKNLLDNLAKYKKGPITIIDDDSQALADLISENPNTTFNTKLYRYIHETHTKTPGITTVLAIRIKDQKNYLLVCNVSTDIDLGVNTFITDDELNRLVTEVYNKLEDNHKASVWTDPDIDAMIKFINRHNKLEIL